jgi:hypothetical protein
MKGLLRGAVLFVVMLSGACAAWAQTQTLASPAPAPAASSAAVQLPAWKPSYAGEQNDIANPHRSTAEITAWAQQAATDVLSFGREDRAAKMEGFKKYFVSQSWQLYASYLRDSKILDMVDQNGYSVGTIVSRAPEIRDRGSSNGAYHWIVGMPITISFYKKDPASGALKPGPARGFYLFLDISRVAEGGGDDGIAIINWRVMDAQKN